MSNRYGREHKLLPHCLRKLPENQPRNRQEYLIRKVMNPEDVEMYFDRTGRYLYDTKCMSQELERLKECRRRALSIVSNHTQFLKSLIMGEHAKPELDITSMRTRYRKAQAKASQLLIEAREKEKTKPESCTDTLRSLQPQRSASCTSSIVSTSDDSPE